MKRFIAFLILALAAITAVAQGPNQNAVFALDFGKWSIVGSGGSFNFPLSACSVPNPYSAGIFPAFNTNAPLLITDGNPTNSEVVTPSLVFGVNNCGFTASATHQHQSFTVSSGTAGLQEAIDYAAGTASHPSLIQLNTAWWTAANSVPGTSGTAIIAAAKGSTAANLIDLGSQTIYTWNGSVYVASVAGGVSGVTGTSPITSTGGATPAIGITTTTFALLGRANTFGAFANSFLASTWIWPACVGGVSSATNNSCLDAGTGAHVWNPFTLADVLIGSGGLAASGTPLIHQNAVWVNATTLKGIANGTTGQFWGANTGADPSWQTPSGTGTVTSFSAGTLSPLFTTSVATATTTPALTFALSNFAADSIFGNFTGSSAAPSTQAIPSCASDGAHALTYPSHTLTCTSVTGSGGIGGVNVQTTSYQLVAGDSGKLVVMNCSGACVVTMPTGPSSTFFSGIISIGSTTPTVSLNSLTYNGSATVPVLLQYREMDFYSDGTNFFGQSPFAAGTGITLTPGPANTTIASTGSGAKTIPINLGVGQGGSGCSLAWNFVSATAPTCLFTAGSSTTPQFATPQFTVAGAIGTGTALYVGPLTVPSNYTANGNLTINLGIACPVSTSGTVTFKARFADITNPAAVQPTFFTTDYSTGAVTVSGTVNNSVVASIVLTPNTGGSPTVTAGDQLFFVIYFQANATAVNPYISQMYVSY